MRLSLSPLLASLALSGCPERAPPPIPVLDLTRPSTQVAPRVLLAPADLSSSAAFDALEDRHLARRDPRTLVSALDLVADTALSAPPGTPLSEADALLVQRLAILHLLLADLGDRGAVTLDQSQSHTARAIDLAMKLADRAPTSPHSLFLQGYVPFAQLGGSDRRDAFIDPTDLARKPFRDAIVSRWSILLEAAPDYQGPRGFSAARIKRAVELVKAAEAPPASGDRPVPAAPGRLALRDEAFAVAELVRLERAPDGVRATACRDWMASADQREDAPAVHRLTLFCATHNRRADLAVSLIGRLAEVDGDATDVCLAWARLVDRIAPAELAAARGKDPRADAALARCR